MCYIDRIYVYLKLWFLVSYENWYYKMEIVLYVCMYVCFVFVLCIFLIIFYLIKVFFNDIM